MIKSLLGEWRHDLPASIVVFLVALPLCMGIAIASGAPPAAGLITGIVGGIVVGALSGSPLQVSGPAAGLTVIVWDLIQRFGFEILGVCVVAAGFIQAAAALAGGGRWFRAIAPAVVYGMLGGIGVLIFASQFHVMVDDKPAGNGLENLLSIPRAIAKGVTPHPDTPHHVAAFIGVVTIATLALWSWLRPRRLHFIPAPLVAVVVAVVASQIISAEVQYVAVPSDLFSATTTPGLGAFQRLFTPEILGAALGVAVVASAETLLCAGAVDRMQDRVKTNYNRELFAQGVGNALCGLLGGLPMTGVIVRSAANVESGARTRLSAIVHGIWLLAVVMLAPGLLRLVPTSALAAILVYTGYKLVNPAQIKTLRQYGWSSVAIYAATLVGIVTTDLLKGVGIGVALSLLRLLYRLTHLEVRTIEDPETRRIDVELRGAATFVRVPKLARELERIPSDREIHVHVNALTYVDHASLDALREWERQRTQRGDHVVLEWRSLSDVSEQIAE